MEIGIHAFNAEQLGPYRKMDDYAAHCKDIGFTWTKIGVGITDNEDIRPRLESAREAGLRCVVDIQATVEYLSTIAIEAQVRLNDEGKLLGKQPGDGPERIQEIIIQNQETASAIANGKLADKARAFVELHKDFCEDYEFWGEYRCAWVSRGIFDRHQAYPAILIAIHKAIHDVMPEARVWNGGYGMDLDINFILGLLQEDAENAFEVCNWHPYFMHIRDRARATDLAEKGYTEIRRRLDEAGTSQPFACTEWGYPTLPPDMPEEFKEYLRSAVVKEGVQQLTCEEAVEWYEADLEIMERHGFQVVMVHELVDHDAEKNVAKHWGGFCGLLTTDGKRKPTYDVIQKWAHKGRAGKPAFAEAAPDGESGPDVPLVDLTPWSADEAARIEKGADGDAH